MDQGTLRVSAGLFDRWPPVSKTQTPSTVHYQVQGNRPLIQFPELGPRSRHISYVPNVTRNVIHH
jgi:hypothetical protein